MKAKKLAALAMACVVVAASGAVLAACKKGGSGEQTGGFKEDTRIWYAVGNSEKGTLKDNGWKPQVAAESLTFTRDTTKTDENVFTLHMDIYAGDGFKFLYKTSADETLASDDEAWARQVGIYNFTNVSGEGADAVIKDGDTTLFTTKDGIDANNLYCAKGQDGKYTITLKTYPEKGKDEKVEFTITKDEAITIPYDMYVYGDMNDFGWKDKADYAMTAATGVWSYKLTVGADDLTRDASGAVVETGAKYAAIQLNNEGEGAATGDPKTFALTPEADSKILKVTDKDHGDVNLLPEGKWVITFTEEGKAVAITESAYELYLIGSFNGWKEADENYKMTEQSDGTWTANVTVEKDEEIKSFNKLGLPNDRYSAGANIPLTAGTWAVKYNPETNSIQVEKCEYYIVGGYTDPAWGDGLTANKAVKLTETETAGTYTGEVTLVAGTEFKVVRGTVLCGPKDWYGNGGDANFSVSKDATYVITAVVAADGSVTATCVEKAA